MSGLAIHPTALVAPGARLAAGVQVGPYAVIEEDTEIGEGCAIAAHAVVKRYTRLGPRNRIGEHAVIGGEPQDFKFKGWPSAVVIGEGNVLREGVTVHRGSTEGAVTRIGNGCFLMAGSHVGHDCQLGDQVILANGALVAGFVTVGDRAFVSGHVAIHQFCRVGRLAMLGGLARISQDALPFIITEGSPARARGLNLVGLKRAGVGEEDIRELKRAYRTLFLSGLLLEQALAALGESTSPLVAELVRFIRESKRGITRGGR